jgi:hypothetical protein
MSTTMIQIRNVPRDLHREARSKAALEGVTLSDFALRALEREVRRPTAAEIAARIPSLPPLDEGIDDVAMMVREEREGR